MILIVAEIIQKGLTISSSTSDIPYQYSGNIQMQFIKDEGYDNFSVIGFYRTNYFEKTVGELETDLKDAVYYRE
jgi:hypothetical protein